MLEELREAGLTNVKIEYNGSNDEGYIEESHGFIGEVEARIDPDLESDLERWAYDVLEDHHAGWEINEGSSGEIFIDVVNNKVTLNHNENVVITKAHTAVWEL